MTAFTHTSLQDEIKRYFEDTDTEFTTQIPNLISQGEVRIYGDLNLETVLKEGTMSLSVSNPVVLKPSNCVVIHRVQRANGDFLRHRQVDFVRRLQNGQAEAPLYWAEVSLTEIEVGPVPDASEILKTRYLGPNESLSGATPETWLSRNFGDLLLMSCLWAGETFNKNVEGEKATAETYATFLTKARDDLVGRGRQPM